MTDRNSRFEVIGDQLLARTVRARSVQALLGLLFGAVIVTAVKLITNTDLSSAAHVPERRLRFLESLAPGLVRAATENSPVIDDSAFADAVSRHCPDEVIDIDSLRASSKILGQRISNALPTGAGATPYRLDPDRWLTHVAALKLQRFTSKHNQAGLAAASPPPLLAGPPCAWARDSLSIMTSVSPAQDTSPEAALRAGVWVEDGDTLRFDSAAARRALQTRSAWLGIEGCVFAEASEGLRLTNAIPSSARARCAKVGGVADGAPLHKTLPSSLTLFSGGLAPWRNPQHGAFAEMTAQLGAARDVTLKGVEHVPSGMNAVVSGDAELSDLAQQVAACFTGEEGRCPLLPSSNTAYPPRHGYGYLGNARAQQVSIVVLDTRDGALLASAGASRACAPGDADCAPPEVPVEHAPLIEEFAPGSLVKVPAALALLADRSFPEREKAFLLSTAIPRSRTDHFQWWMHCLDRGDAAGCTRMKQGWVAARSLGFNAGCQPGWAQSPSPEERDCRTAQRRGLISELAIGTPGASLGAQRFGNVFDDPAVVAPVSAERAEVIRGCALAAAGKLEPFASCRRMTSEVVPSISEMLGSGDARITTLGAAYMMARLQALSTGVPDYPWPHTLTRLIDAEGRSFAAPLLREPLDARLGAAALSLRSSLADTLRIGSAASACRAIHGEGCAREVARLQLAGKTGTPGLALATQDPNRQRRLMALRALMKKEGTDDPEPDLAKAYFVDQMHGNCKRHDGEPANSVTKSGDCRAPMKLFAGLYTPPGRESALAIAVTVRRNYRWMLDTGDAFIDDPFDRGTNVAAEIALLVAAMHSTPDQADHGAR